MMPVIASHGLGVVRLLITLRRKGSGTRRTLTHLELRCFVKLLMVVPSYPASEEYFQTMPPAWPEKLAKQT